LASYRDVLQQTVSPSNVGLPIWGVVTVTITQLPHPKHAVCSSGLMAHSESLPLNFSSICQYTFYQVHVCCWQIWEETNCISSNLAAISMITVCHFVQPPSMEWQHIF
jgi:hypothetical protein